MTLTGYNETCLRVSQLVIQRYSTSFYLGSLMFPYETRKAISAIYGLMRLADEIVDTFHDYDKAAILAQLRGEVEMAWERGISMNPVVQAFQWAAQTYGIEKKWIDAFFKSMEMDLTSKRFDRAQYDEYIYGSAEVVGLMCLKVFCAQSPGSMSDLTAPARALGAAFQKVNFLRDIKNDLDVRGRIYLAGLESLRDVTDEVKRKTEQEIEKDFKNALGGIGKLPRSAKLAVYSTFLYYEALLRKIKSVDVPTLLSRRIRVPDIQKMFLLLCAWLKIVFRKI